ncbi:hypothetical protein [Rhizobium sp. RCAM05973]|uniref:hypothetical protein n=1 Tax=Rhizobium sp. RCAM05973 TaxID=2994066 RepID=UPI0022EBD7C5|nr:hypothetical protein [Rhizobium sp. RCAM05973]
MAHQDEFLRLERVRHSDDVFRKPANAEPPYVYRRRRKTVPFKIERHHPESAGQLRYLETPKNVATAPAMKQEQKRPLFSVHFEVVDGHSAVTPLASMKTAYTTSRSAPGSRVVLHHNSGLLTICFLNARIV